MSESQAPPPRLYFFLSYAHSAPTSGHVGADPDPSVEAFFADLEEAVARRARPAENMRFGFFDQQIPAGADIKGRLSLALGAAEVFVPLYSPGYFARGWPQREQEVFRRRLKAAGAAEPERHVVPVLWTPVPPWEQNPEVLRTLQNEPADPDYRENGLRALLMLTAYRRSYESVLVWLADEVVRVAEQLPLGPSVAPDLDVVPDPVATDASFLVAMLAPGPAAEAEQKWTDASWWRTYAGRRIPPVADHAGTVAERLGLRTRVGELGELEKHFDHIPAIVLVDPQVLDDRGAEYLRSTFGGFPAWVVPVILDPGTADRSDTAFAVDEVAALVGPRRTPATRVAGVNALDEILPTLVARARRAYLREGPVFPPGGAGPRVPRLSDADARGGGEDAGDG